MFWLQKKVFSVIWKKQKTWQYFKIFPVKENAETDRFISKDLFIMGHNNSPINQPVDSGSGALFESTWPFWRLMDGKNSTGTA